MFPFGLFALLQIGDMEKARGYFARIEQIGTKYREASTYYVAYIDYATGKYNNALVGIYPLERTCLIIRSDLCTISRKFILSRINTRK